MRSSNGCWTCRIRRKKCDENHPVCGACVALDITCHNDQDNKPEWMDGGVKQAEMAEFLKREVKEKARSRRGDHTVRSNGFSVPPQETPRDLAIPVPSSPQATINVRHEMEPSFESPTLWAEHRLDGINSSQDASKVFGQSDAVLLMFYLDTLLPFLYPFYRPSLLEGGRAWVLEMLNRPVVRQATISQSIYFFSLALGTPDVVWEKVLSQTRDAFEVLRQVLQLIDGVRIAENLHSAVRIMANIVQLQHFEIAALSSNNWQAQLNTALALFRQLLDNPSSVEGAGPSSRFNYVMSLLGPLPWILPTQSVQVPSAEQAAFRFSSTLMLLDDIIASTVLQEQPRLYEYHHGLLKGNEVSDPPINAEAIIGIKNWVLLHIGEIATLDAWKQRCKEAGDLDVMELGRRAIAIKESLIGHLMRFETETSSAYVPNQSTSPLDMFSTCSYQPLQAYATQATWVTRIWAHAAFVYLFVVVSGWQPASVDVRYHVDRVVELTKQISPRALLRTIVWPLCVAGCLAEPAQESQLRVMVEALQPSVFGTVHKALKIMESVWHNRDAADTTARDFATCFRSQGDLVLLV